MKILKYNLCTKVNHGTEEEPQIEEILSPVTMGWNEANEEIAKKEAWGGEYEICDDREAPTPAEKIAELKENLQATDYKVIKCSECQLLGEELPYDVEELHAQRQALRDQINELEKTNE